MAPKPKPEKPDLWPNRAKFRELVDEERTSLGMSAGDYWLYLGGVLGISDRNCRALYSDKNQTCSPAITVKMARHYRVKAEDLSIPTPQERKAILATYAQSFMPTQVEAPAPKPRAEPRTIVTRQEDLDRAAFLKDLTGKLNRLELVHLRFIGMLLEPYWGLFGIKD